MIEIMERHRQECEEKAVKFGELTYFAIKADQATLMGKGGFMYRNCKAGGRRMETRNNTKISTKRK
jgi:hypothetical protein